MERAYAQHLADITGRSFSSSRQLLRALREDGLVPGHGETPTATDIANIVLALSAETIATAPDRVRNLSALPQTSTTGLPQTAGAMLAALLIARKNGPVFDDFDVEDGSLHLGPTSMVLECLTLTGKRACVRYGADAAGISKTTTIPLPVVAKFSHLI
ncbi:MAG: hypothetical protein ABS54_06325 [Hyphomicrobium sp. SCN 65-11]|nr:MAG: hypothetical protein ABS54_06325 [Hyphomicrobium sp. SCN 65-11]